MWITFRGQCLIHFANVWVEGVYTSNNVHTIFYQQDVIQPLPKILVNSQIQYR